MNKPAHNKIVNIALVYSGYTDVRAEVVKVSFSETQPLQPIFCLLYSEIQQYSYIHMGG